MPAYDIDATVSSPPFDVAVKIADQVKLRMKRADDGSWEGSKKNVDLSGTPKIVFDATGITGSPWKLGLTFTPSDPTSKDPTATYSKSGKIDNNGDAHLEDTIDLTKPADGAGGAK